ncbi:rhomboid family intramembrane serine protease [Entomomonas asaccharolytica]|uniref:Rhomboid family intramembrane serine protease n=1 Tax=Entomomonas asaccharolytica TaxID=2785331 RepID=A0A974NHK2_9GAMM|nr:rhomboid family intramembrane serine protease [Entomomonas asaccharolytica]QQP86682.1 rhomboid family intramembrane serine protease [Entomomonas asaccharolytica]
MLSKQIRIVLAITVLMVIIHIINMVLAGGLASYGVVPRQLDKLWGIFTSPWIHSGVLHLLGNLSCFVVLAWLCMLRSIRYFMLASLFIIVVGGLLLWVVGRTASHIGASGWIFGLWGLLLGNAYFDRTIKNILICILVMLLYGGFIFGLLPSAEVSFEGHITGMLSGILFAWLTVNNKSLKAALAVKQSR